jgi:plasmid maintenance system antidote protein VapI
MRLAELGSNSQSFGSEKLMNQTEIRTRLQKYMDEHKIGVPSLATKADVPIKTLTRLMKGSFTVSQEIADRCERFLKAH